MKRYTQVLDSTLKRLLDIVVAATGLILTLPLWVIIGAAIKLSDGGPVFYRSQRVGRQGQPFRLWKFRTMVAHADRHGPAVTAHGDPRITPLGYWLRRTKLDELPQLLNVLVGDMSLVGPRPEDPRYVALYTPEQRQILSVRPGITSAASLEYRHEEEILANPDWETIYQDEVMPAKLAIDLEYLSRRTLWTDLGLILRTVVAMFKYTSFLPQKITRLVDFSTAFLLQFRNRHFLAIDMLIFVLTPVVALALRLDFIPWLPAESSLSKHAIPLAVVTLAFLVVKLVIFYTAGIYRRYWRYASIDELAQIISASLLVLFTQSLIFFVVLRPAGLIPGFPRSVPLLDALLTLLAVGGFRYTVRMAERLSQRIYSSHNAERVLVAGAGEAGVMIVKEMQSNPQLGLYPVAFVDDDPAKQGAKIRGVSVRGDHHHIATLVRQTRARKVIIAMPTAPGKVIREIVAICEQVGVKTQIIPGVYELLDGTVNVNQLRDIEIEDLLRRAPVQTDVAAVSDFIRGKRVLITGGGGSIGSELCRQVLRYGPDQLTVLGHGENSVFEIHNELQIVARKLANLGAEAMSARIHAAIADIRFTDRLQAIFNEYRPQIVFHAAAHKHVPMMELNPAEAITNNVLGTRNLLNIALAAGVERFVMISTDKAVKPSSIMGASKRVAELLVYQAAQTGRKPYVTVRFGNVLGSRGSVVHTFKQQIAAGGPVTVTHPDMRRYFMSIPEAVQLVLQAAVLGQGGEVFMLDMGQPVKIVDLARDMIELSGLEVGRDIDIVFTNPRPGEKLFEELFVPGEVYQQTQHEKIFIANNANHYDPLELNEAIKALEIAARRSDNTAILQALKSLIPEFQSPQKNGEKKAHIADPLASPSLRVAPHQG